jgi:hypothetical protein
MDANGARNGREYLASLATVLRSPMATAATPARPRKRRSNRRLLRLRSTVWQAFTARSLARIPHHASTASAQPPASPGRVLVRVLNRPQACLRAQTSGPARIYSRLLGLATIRGEKCRHPHFNLPRLVPRDTIGHPTRVRRRPECELRRGRNHRQCRPM